MANLINFVTLLNGKFDNKDQFEKISKTNPQYPYAKHINTICNSKIANLPNGFEGVFMIEESYYSVQGTTRSSSHLFLFMEENNSIKLISYEIPEGYDKKNFTYKIFKGADYDQLKCSAKFTPAFFRKSPFVILICSTYFTPLYITISNLPCPSDLRHPKPAIYKKFKSSGVPVNL